MITTIKGDLLAVPTGIIVHGCNAQGVMGSGVALAVKNKYPIAYNLYKQQYELEGLQLGDIQIVLVEPNKYIINAITQENCGSDGRQYVSYEALTNCFYKINQFAMGFVEIDNQLSVCFPKIGAGLGGGNWNIIEGIIDGTLNDILTKELYII